jgi:manganese/zinc/iron transport system ATP- binding protein
MSNMTVNNNGTAIEIHDLTVAYQDNPVLWDIDLDVPKGVLAAIVGPNGAGKSTLIKTILGLIRPVAGEIQIFGQPYQKQRQIVGYVPQRTSVDWDFPTSVLDVVTMGLYGQLGWIKRPGKKEQTLALEALHKMGMAEFANRQISQLSGGQQQRTFLARALVQDAQVYFMDEPLQGVDIHTEKAVIMLLRELRNKGKTLMVVHHDLQTVPEYFDWVVMLNKRLTVNGAVADVFTEDNLKKTYHGLMSFMHKTEPAV